jgi:gas vesicle protein
MTMGRDEEREVVYIERGEGPLKPILFGALLGFAVGLLFAPQSGEETRRALRRRVRKVRALAEEKVGELSERITSERQKPARRREEARDEARGELERRLAEARSRRRTTASAGEEEEPVA